MSKIRLPYAWLLIGPSLCFFFGFFLNSITVAANRGHMPVLTSSCESRQIVWEATEDSVHVCMTKETHLKILSDWVYIPTIGTASIGDGFMYLYDKTAWYCWFIWLALMIKEFNGRKVNEERQMWYNSGKW